MLDDDPRVDGPGRFDVCIVGGGPAGIATALRVAQRTDLRVCLVESGGDRFDPETQELARAESDGLDYYPFHETRVRALGGSTWSWGGICTPLDPMAFESRPWIPNGGWPLPRSTFDAYLDDALSLCGITPEARAETLAVTDATFDEAALDRRRVAPVPVSFSRPLRFGPTYRAELDAQPNLVVRCQSTVTRLVVDGDALRAVEGIGPGRQPFRIEAQTFVLAGGGIENARVLMVAGLGGPAVGRYFMEHPRVGNRYHVRSGDTALGRLVGGGAAGTLRFFRLSVADVLQRSDELLNYHANLQFGYVGQRSRQWPAVRRLAIVMRPPWNESPYFQDAGGGKLHFRLADLGTAMRRPDMSALSAIAAVTEHPSLRRYLEIWSAIEQVPEARNRLELAATTDAFGVPRVRLHWTVGEAEERTYRHGLATLVSELERLEPGISKAALDEPEPWPDQLIGNWHHEGTTRMHDDPSLGVVDRDCRVHGLRNLYAAGSSVFPVSGSTSPTVTIIQLALRLGDHLATELQAIPVVATRERVGAAVSAN